MLIDACPLFSLGAHELDHRDDHGQNEQKPSSECHEASGSFRGDGLAPDDAGE